MQERRLYKLENQEYPSVEKVLDLLNAERVQLPDEDFQVATELVGKLPKQIIYESDPIIGCPDYLDQGGFYLSERS